MNEVHFYDYPLCLHAFGTTPNERINAIMAWCWVKRGIAVIGQRSGADAIAMVNKLTSGNLPSGLQKSNRLHCAVALGVSAFGCSGGNAQDILMLYHAADSRVDYFNRYGKQVYASMRGDLLFEVRNGKGISWREYSILAAVRSFVGKTRRYAWVTRSVIATRALGYKTEAVMAAELGNRKDSAKPFTLKQLNRSLDRLDERLLFARVRKDHWHTYYSTRLNRNELETALAAKSDYKADFHKKRIEQNKRFLKINRPGCQQPNVSHANVSQESETKFETAHAELTMGLTGRLTSYKPLHINSNIKTESTSGIALLNDEKQSTLESVQPMKLALEASTEWAPPTLVQVEEAFDGFVRPSKELAADWFREKGKDPAWSKLNWKNHITKWLSNREGVEWI